MSIRWDEFQQQYSARLIPNPRGAPEARATAALLAMVRGVSEFGGSFVKRCGGSRYKDMRRYVQCFTEIPFDVLSNNIQQLDSSRPSERVLRHMRHYARPDGVVLVRKGKQEWKALVEVKVGASKLEDDPDQIAEYHRQASRLGFDALVTISNEPALPGGHPPRGVQGAIDGRRARRCPVIHIQWRDLLGDAQTLIDRDLEENVQDIDQSWMLHEWIRYVTDDASGILVQPTLGQHWADIIEQAAQSRLLKRTDDLEDVVTHWIGYFGEIGYRLRLLGIRVTPRLSRKEKAEPEALVRRLCDQCIKDGCLRAEWNVPGPVDSFRCMLYMGHRKIHYSFDVTTFNGKSAASRVMEWVGQLDRRQTPDDLIITIAWKGQRNKTSLLIREIEGVIPLQRQLQAQGVERSSWPTCLSFEWVRSLPRKRGRHGTAHLDAITAGMVRFYEDVAAGLRSVERMPKRHASQSVPSEPQKQPSIANDLRDRAPEVKRATTLETKSLSDEPVVSEDIDATRAMPQGHATDSIDRGLSAN